jgi:hypothetical protein
MLVLKCSDCRRKHRCHKDRIRKVWNLEERDGRAFCPCGRAVGIDRGTYYAMDRKAFTYKGTKTNG